MRFHGEIAGRHPPDLRRTAGVKPILNPGTIWCDVPATLRSGLVWNRTLRLIQLQTDPRIGTRSDPDDPRQGVVHLPPTLRPSRALVRRDLAARGDRDGGLVRQVFCSPLWQSCGMLHGPAHGRAPSRRHVTTTRENRHSPRDRPNFRWSAGNARNSVAEAMFVALSGARTQLGAVAAQCPVRNLVHTRFSDRLSSCVRVRSGTSFSRISAVG